MELQPGQVRAILGDIPFGSVDSFGVDWGWETVEGWGATASTLEAVQKSRAAGAWGGDAFAKARNLALSGKAYAPSPEAAVAALDRLNSAVSLSSTLLTVMEPGLSRSLTVRRTDDVLHQWMMPTIFAWSIQVVALDPRKFGTELSGSTALPSFSGGLTVPFTVPFTVDSVLVSGQVNLINPGNEVGPVRLRIDGPCHGPSISHAASGLALTFSSSLVLGAGEWLEVDMEARTVMANGQSSRSGYVTARGWSGFTPGLNSWSFTATSFDAGALLSVMATPAWK